MAGQAAGAPLFTNGGFEDGTTGWSFTGNAAIRQSAPYTADDGVRLVAFNTGNTTPNGTVSRGFATIPGNTYRLDFAAGVLSYQTAVQQLGITVTGGSPLLVESVSITGQAGGQALWTDKSFYFTADGTTATLSFRDLSGGTSGIDLLLDGVVVELSAVKPLVNGGFESGTLGWTASGNVRAIPVPAYQPTEGLVSASFNTGDSTPNGVLRQVVTTKPGTTYLLTYDTGIISYLRGWVRLQTRILGNGPWYSELAREGSGKGTVEWWRNSHVTFVANANLTEIEFLDASIHTRSIDLLLDNVRLIEVPPGFALVYPGTFMMGSPEGEYGHGFSETLHSVTFRNSLLAKSTEVTWGEWLQVRDLAQSRGYNDIGTGRNGYNGTPGGTHPVTEVSWWDVLKWCNLRSEAEGLKPVYYSSPSFGAANVLRNGSPPPHADWTADGYRLPTEAEWENLCRAGSTTAYFNGPPSPMPGGLDSTLDVSGWYSGNSGPFSQGVFGNTHPVATKIANSWGFHDTHGNVWEWCWDLSDDTPYPPDPVTDPRGPAVGLGRMIRGGSFHMEAYWHRCAQRPYHDPTARYFYLGFRPVRTVVR